MKKSVVTLFALIVSTSAFAAGSGAGVGKTGGKCFVDGEFIGKMSTEQCKVRGGKVSYYDTKAKAWKPAK